MLSSDYTETQRDRILKQLSQKSYVYTTTMKNIAAQYNARIYELRKTGHTITALKIGKRRAFRLETG